jgi:hypothetical protein
MSFRVTIFALCFLVFVAFGNAHSQGAALSVKASTIGFGIDVTKSFSSKLNGRIGASMFNYSHSGETEAENPVEYDLDIKLQTFSALLDYYPFQSGFFLSAGLVNNAMDVEGSGIAVKDYVFDGNVYTPEDIGTLTIETKPSLDFSPYLGLGLGNPVGADKKLGFILELGVLYIGAPEVTLLADEDSMIFPTTDQEAEAEEFIKDLKWYPVVNLGLSYKF